MPQLATDSPLVMIVAAIVIYALCWLVLEGIRDYARGRREHESSILRACERQKMLDDLKNGTWGMK